MFLIALRDLQFRLRRFAISVVAVALVLSLTLLLSGVASSFDTEIDHTLDQMAVSHWVVQADSSGPFFGAVPMTADQVDRVSALPGVQQAQGQAFRPYTINTPGGPEGVTLLGVEPGGLGSPQTSHGRGLQQPGEALVQPAFGLGLGQTIDLGGGQPFRIVGTLDDSTMLGGIPNVFISVNDLQHVAFKDAPVITSVAVNGTPEQVPDGLKVVSRADAHEDLIRPLSSAKNTIVSVSILLWIVAGCIIGSVIYISALERLRDFAVFKAIGISTGWVFGGLIIQAVLLSLVSSAAAIGLGFLLAPRMSVPVTLPIALIALVPIIATVVSVLGTLAGASRAVRVDPALAFG